MGERERVRRERMRGVHTTSASVVYTFAHVTFHVISAPDLSDVLCTCQSRELK